MTVGQFFGVMLGWVIGDKLVKRKVAAACMLMHAVGLLMLTYATGFAMLIVAALVHGLGWGLRGPFMQAIRADYFGRRSIGMIMGLSALITVTGQIGGPMIAGAFADWTGRLPDGLHGARGDGRVGVVVFLVGEAAEVTSALSSHPFLRQHLGLLQHGLRRLLLLVRRVAVLAQDALHDHAQLRPHVLAHRPVDGDVLPHRLDQLAGDRRAASSSPSTFTALSFASSAS